MPDRKLLDVTSGIPVVLSQPLPTAGTVLYVAPGGGTPYTTIGAAISAASSGDEIVVLPGTYAESITIPDGVLLRGAHFADSVKITGADTTSTRVTFSGSSSLHDVSITGPSSGTNPTIDATGLASGKVVLIGDVFLVGAGAGSGIKGAGSGRITQIGTLTQTGGTFTGPLVENTAGISTYAYIAANSGVSSDIGKVSAGTLRILGGSAGSSATYTVTDILEVAGGTLEAQNVVVGGSSTPATNGLHVSADGVTVEVVACSLPSTTYDLLVASGLTGSGTTILLTSVALERAKLSEPSGYQAGCDLFLGFTEDTGASGDNPGYKLEGSMEVGSVQLPSTFSVGTGAPTILNRVGYTFDDSGGTYTDVTADLGSVSGSTVSWLLATGDGLYIGTTYKPSMFSYDQTTALSGTLAVEVWTGAAWTAINTIVMATDLRNQYGNTPFQRASVSENLAFDTDGTAWADWAVSDPPTTGTNRYWVRIRNNGAIATSPAIERVLVGQNFSEWNGNGKAAFGTAQSLRIAGGISLGSALGLTGAAAPGNSNIDISTNVTFNGLNNSLGTGDGFGWPKIAVLVGDDTSRPMLLKVAWAPETSSSGENVVFRTITSRYADGDTVAGGLTEETLDTTTANTGGVNIAVITDILIDISNAQPGDVISLALVKQGGTFTGNVRILGVSGWLGSWRQ